MLDFKMDKRGMSQLIETLVFIIINLIFFVFFFIFVARAGSGAAFYEQVYAKQIALLIDQAKPGMSIVFDVGEIVDIAGKNGITGESLKSIVQVDNKEKKVRVVLTKIAAKGYAYNFFNSGNFTAKLNGNLLSLEIK